MMSEHIPSSLAASAAAIPVPDPITSRSTDSCSSASAGACVVISLLPHVDGATLLTIRLKDEGSPSERNTFRQPAFASDLGQRNPKPPSAAMQP